MCRKIKLLLAGCVLCLGITACNNVDPELTKFKNDVDNFCDSIAEIDASMNAIDATSENAPDQLLGYLDELDVRFKNFADLDFPSDFDHLEGLADSASMFMTEAVKDYHESFSNGSYNEYTAEIASHNYAVSMKAINYIIAFLHGETPDDENLVISYTKDSAEEIDDDETPSEISD